MQMKTFVVLGMHRSATSLTSKALANEIDMGAEYRPISDQPHGNWEDLNFIFLNDAILKAAGGSWDEPPSRDAILNVGPQYYQAAELLVNARTDKGVLWGWKDPRTSLTIEIYHPFIKNPHYICNFRNPVDVARSLKARNGFSMDKGIALAKEYNRRIIEFLAKEHL